MMQKIKFEKIIDYLITKHHIVDKNPAARLNYLKTIAKQFNFSKAIQGKIIHIAGTNGKGSTQQFLWDLLKASGYTCHIFRSPHLVTIHERIILNDTMIDDETFIESLLWADSVVTQPIGFFALLTLAFFKCCRTHPADFIVLETGLGGEFDATNILEDHALSIITPLSFDHCEILGYSLAEIAFAKAGIMRAHRPCVSAIQPDEAKKVLQHEALKKNTPLHFLTQKSLGLNLQANSLTPLEHNFQTFPNQFALDDQIYDQPGLIGEHQKNNAALAIVAYQQLIEKKNTLSPQAINTTLKNTYFEGRLHPLKPGSLTQKMKQELWIDGAHNPDGAEKLIPFLKLRHEPIYFWINFKYNKDIKHMLNLTKPYAKKIIFQIMDAPDRASQASIEKICEELSIKMHYCDSLEKAIDFFNQQSKGLVLAFGSLHWVGYLLKINKYPF
jgi:dihydrofolate synthase/folylpolyglutamate synthase